MYLNNEIIFEKIMRGHLNYQLQHISLCAIPGMSESAYQFRHQRWSPLFLMLQLVDVHL
jgi:hypothetical protein